MKTIYKSIRRSYRALINKSGLTIVDVFRFFAFIFAKKLPLKADRYLIIAPHPDDEVFGCAGLLHRLVNDGKNVHVVILTQGETVHKDPLIGVSAVIAKRRELALEAAQALGLTPNQYTFLNWGSSRLHETQNNPVRQKELTSIIETFKPEVIFVPHIYDSAPVSGKQNLPDGYADHFYATEIVNQTIRQLNSQNSSLIPKISSFYYCVWIWKRHSPFRLNWRKSYILTMNKNEISAKNKAVDIYELSVDEYGIPYSGYLYDLPSICRWKKELFF